MKKSALLFMILCSFAKMKSQTYAASNFTLISNISPETYTNSYGDKYSSCWGWYQSSLNKEYAIAGSASGTYWVDVTNPLTPTVSAFRPGKINTTVWREIKTYQNYCYVISDDGGPNSFQIFDMQYLPDSVHKVYDSQNLFKRGHTLTIDGNKLYVAGITYSTGSSSSMNLYSLATPSVPVLLRKLSQDAPFISYVHDMYVENDTVFASCGNQGMYIFKYNPGPNTFTQIGSLTSYTASGFNHSSAWTPDRKTLVLTDEVPAHLPIKILNVQNLSNIQVSATTNQFTNTTPHNPFMVSNKYCFMASYQDGLQLYDISTPTAPVLAGYFDTYFQGGGNNNIWIDDYDGLWSAYPYFPSKNIFALDQRNGLFMLKSHLYQNVMASFTAPSLTICAGSSITFTNTSTGATNYNWTCLGGSPSTSTLTNPTITYNLPGTFWVTLNASNSFTTSTTSALNVYVTQLQANVSSTNASCGICTDGVASVTPTAGTAPYTYTWLPIGGNSATAFNLAPACYSVNIKDANNCTRTSTVCVGTATGLKDVSLAPTNLILYPNPAKNNLTIECDGEVFNYYLYNNLGQVVVINKNIHSKSVIDVQEFSKGVYFIMVETKGERIRRKLIID